MNIYDVSVLEREIEQIAADNDGEFPEEKLRELVEAQTQSIVQIEKLCRYIRHLEQFTEAAKEEKKRINDLQQRAEKRVESIKKYLTPYVKERGKFDAGTFQLSTRKSKAVDLVDGFNNPIYCEEIVIYKPDKKMIKESLERGEKIEGARIVEHENLQVK